MLVELNQAEIKKKPKLLKEKNKKIFEKIKWLIDQLTCLKETLH